MLIKKIKRRHINYKKFKNLLNYNWKMILASTLVLLIWILNQSFLKHILKLSPQNSGLYGDSFGSVNALFSGLAFLGVIWAIMQQSEELKLQREELTLSREELALQRKEMEQTRIEIAGQKLQLELQNKAMQKQGFDNSFFELLKRYDEIVSSFCFNSYTGRLALYQLTRAFNIEKIANQENSDKYERLYNHSPDIYRYMNNLEYLLEFINKDCTSSKKNYVELLKAQLLEKEKELIYCHYNSDFASFNFKDLVIELKILE